MNAPRLVVFDLDDTLADTAGTILAKAERDAAAACVRAGLRATEEEAHRALREIRSSDCGAPFLEMLVSRFGAADPAGCAAAGRLAFFGNDAEGIRLVPGACETLAALRARGIALGLLTYGVAATQEKKLALLGIGEMFDEVRVVDLRVGPDKTSALREMIAAAGVEPGETWVVGDRPPSEIKAGRGAGAFTVRVRRGEFALLEPRDQTEVADRTITSLPELLPLLPASPPRIS